MKILKKLQEYYCLVNPNLRFVLLLLFALLVYDYPSILFKRPQTVHSWRQADCASITLNYYQTGMHFFQPQTHNLTSDDNTSGFNATSEVPVGYYFIACLYKVFGYHEFIFRFVNTLIFLAGLFYLFKLCYLLFKDYFWSTVIPLFFFTSPVLAYYGNNYLTDASAFAFALIAWYYFFKFYISDKQRFLYVSMLFFLLAGAYKITALISLVALTCILLLELTGIFNFRRESKLFKRPLFALLPMIFIYAIIGSWVYYAKIFNINHHTAYFSTSIIPYWDMNKDQIQMVIYNIKKVWVKEYFHVSALYFIAAMFLFTIGFIKKTNRFLMSATLLLFLGTIVYAVLWFSAFQDHDYYTINLYILIVFILINGVLLLKTNFPALFISLYLKIFLICFLLFSMNYARKQVKERYYGWWTDYPYYKDYYTITPYLRSIGIAPLDTVISLPDVSHKTLYLMNQRGWTTCLGNNSDSASISYSINHGAKYLIVNEDELDKRMYLHSFLNNPIGKFNQIKIFKLDK